MSKVVDVDQEFLADENWAYGIAEEFFANHPTPLHGVIGAAEILLQINKKLKDAGARDDSLGEFWGSVLSTVAVNSQDASAFKSGFQGIFTNEG
jgi:hypothetical protein